MYNPQPIDTSKVELSDDISMLVEKLAENTHDNWALQRMSDGWILGEERDDARKLHPCLVPYAELPEFEKIYDRKTSVEIIKTLIAMGYKITK